MEFNSNVFMPESSLNSFNELFYNLFNIYLMQEEFFLPLNKPDIGKVLNYTADVVITSKYVSKTSLGKSLEGHNLSGRKQTIVGEIRFNVEYTPEKTQLPDQFVEFNKRFITSIILNESDNEQSLETNSFVIYLNLNTVEERKLRTVALVCFNVIGNINEMKQLPHRKSQDKLINKYTENVNVLSFEKKKNLKQDHVTITHKISDDAPDVRQVLSKLIDVEVMSIRIIDTFKGVSMHNTSLTGKMAIIDLKFNQKVIYQGENECKNIHGFEFSLYHTVFVVVPCYIEGTCIKRLLKNKYIKPDIFIEEVATKRTDLRTVTSDIFFSIELRVAKTYELCLCEMDSKGNSTLKIALANGKKCAKLIDYGSRIFDPVWSVDGRIIGFLSDQSGKTLLYTVNCDDLSVKNITSPDCFKHINDYCWSNGGRTIIFSGCLNSHNEIFNIDVKTLECEKIISRNQHSKYVKLQVSSDERILGFLKLCQKKSDVWICKTNGLDLKQLTKCGGVKEFVWIDNFNIVYIELKNNQEYLYVVHVVSFETTLIKCNDSILKHKLLVSPDKKYCSFIGVDKGVFNIYLYCFENGEIDQLTNYNDKSVVINDYIWRIDGESIYYVTNELGYYNIFTMSIVKKVKCQITNSLSYKTEIRYRPRIF